MSDAGAGACEGTGVHGSVLVGGADNGDSTDSQRSWISMFTESHGRPGLNPVIAEYNNPYNVLAKRCAGECVGFVECEACVRCPASSVP